MKEVPGLLEYLGYTFCFANILAGPAFEFSTYRDACDGTLLYNKDGKPRGKIPSTIMPSLVPFIKSMLCIGLYVVVGGMFPLLDPVDPQKNTPIVVQDEFLKNSWFYRYAYMWIGLFGVRCKYYFAWTNAEGANNLWYAGFEGFDEKGNAKGWSTSNNVDILGFEIAPSLSQLSKDWNKKTSLWLTRYVYIRTGGNLMAVYSLSAFWHGFYPGRLEGAGQRAWLKSLRLLLSSNFDLHHRVLLVLFVGSPFDNVRTFSKEEDLPVLWSREIQPLRHCVHHRYVCLRRVHGVGLHYSAVCRSHCSLEESLFLWTHLEPWLLRRLDVASSSQDARREEVPVASV